MQQAKLSFIDRWSQWHRSLWFLLFLVLISLSVGRFLLLYFQGPELASLPLADLKKAFWVGMRFDLKHVAIFLGSLVVISLFFYRASAQWWRGFYRFSVAYSLVFILLLNLLSVVNYYYFSFYQSPINALVFGFAEDDTNAVIATMWHDFPVIRLLALVMVLSWMQVYLAFKIGLPAFLKPMKSPMLVVAVMLCSVLLLVFFGRGSLGKFPLRAMHMGVSSNTFVNQLVPSGFHALYLAFKERKNDNLGTDPNRRLTQFGFTDWQQAASVCFGTPITTFTELQQTLPTNTAVAKQAPHVVLAVMEAWGRHLMAFDHAENNDMLGALRPWVEEKGDYFEQGLSVQNGTHPSLEGLLFDTPITPLTQGRSGYVSYDTSRVLPYKKAGYKTVFLTAGPGNWRQLQDVLLRQGFDEVHDEQSILKAYPEATTHTWGVDDEWMFKYGAELLSGAETRGEKLMLVMLSVTNHPPYRIPKHYQPLPLDENVLGAEMAVDATMGRSILETYQYANSSLGDFLQSLEEKKILPHTIFAASGDHSTRSIFSYPDSSYLPYKFGVPLLFYIPEAYRLPQKATKLTVDKPATWVAHDDIFPTLWAHSLSEQEVPLSSGQNLYAVTPETSRASSLVMADGDMGLVINQAGAVTNLSSPNYYEWADASKLRLQPLASPTPELLALLEHERACLALRDWRIRYAGIKKQ